MSTTIQENGFRAATRVALVVTAVFTGGVLAQDSGLSLDEARSLIKQGKYSEAETVARDLMDEMKAVNGDETEEYAAVLDALVESLWRGGKAQQQETQDLAGRAISLKEKHLGPRHADLAESLNNLAVIDVLIGRYPDAQGLWERALSIRIEALGPHHPDVAQLMNNLGNLFLRTGDFGAALPLYEEALSIRREALGDEHPLIAQSLNNLATLRVEMGDYAEALPLVERGLELYEKVLPPGHPKIANSLSVLARVMLETGDPERAIDIYKQAEQLWESSLGSEHPSYAIALSNRAELLFKLGRLDEARLLYEQAVAILEAAYGSEHPRVAGTLSGLGGLEEAAGRIEEAIALQERVVAIKEKTLGDDHPRLALSLTDLGRLRFEVGDITAAGEMLERAVTIRRSVLGSTHPVVAESLIELATVRLAEGNVPAAIDGALESETIAREHLRLTARSLSEQHALRYARSRKSGLDLALSMAAAGKLDPSARRDTLDSLIRSRAVVLDGVAARHRTAILANDPEIARLAEALAVARTRLANMAVRGPGDLDAATYRNLFEDAHAAKEDAERALAAASVSFAAERERGRMGLSDLSARLAPNAAIVSIVRYQDLHLDPGEPDPAASPDRRPALLPARSAIPSYMATVLRAGEPDPVFISLGAAAEVDALVSDWKTESSGTSLFRDPSRADREYARTAQALERRIWDPVADHLEGIDRVFVVPDGSLNLVSLASLPTRGGGYLLENGPIFQYLSSERDLTTAGETRTHGKGLLAVGAPDYGDFPVPAALQERTPGAVTRSGCGNLEALRFEPLPETAREVERIVDIWRRSTGPEASTEEQPLLLMRSRASEAAFKKAAPGRSVLHLATHGFFLGGDCMPSSSSARGMGGVAIGTKPATPTAAALTVENPLLQSGLVLAGANRRDDQAGAEDGVLTAEEIVSLDLSGVDLAVLSACDTGLGEIRTGEGVFGLRRAMQVAGVRSLVLSLWSVDDESTRTWMEAFYRGLLEKRQTTAEAARGAGRAVLDARREAGLTSHPFFWGAFVATGSGEL